MKIGIITFGGGAREGTETAAREALKLQARIATWLGKEGHQVVEARRVVEHQAAVRPEARRVHGCDAVLFHFPLDALPDLVAQAAQLLPRPLLLLGNTSPAHAGWASLLAAAGTLEEIGVGYTRAVGELGEKATQEQLRAFLRTHSPEVRSRGAAAAGALFGQRYGQFGGPSGDLYPGPIDASQWMQQFGLHVVHHSLSALHARRQEISKKRVQTGIEWLDAHGAIQWNRTTLTRGLEGTLARQVRLYLALKDLCKAEAIDCGTLAGGPDLVETPDGCLPELPVALLNDPADWEGKTKQPIMCAADGDGNGALTMQLLHHLSGAPVFTAELRHYHAKPDLYDLTPAGHNPPWFARRSKDFRVNWRQVHLSPLPPKQGKVPGARVSFPVEPADPVTFARLTRAEGRYRLHLFSGAFVRVPKREQDKLAKQTEPEGPHVFARLDSSFQHLTRTLPSPRVHAVVGDYVGELLAACETLGVEGVMGS